jgi:hypothetical protein
MRCVPRATLLRMSITGTRSVASIIAEPREDRRRVQWHMPASVEEEDCEALLGVVAQ